MEIDRMQCTLHGGQRAADGLRVGLALVRLQSAGGARAATDEPLSQRRAALVSSRRLQGVPAIAAAARDHLVALAGKCAAPADAALLSLPRPVAEHRWCVAAGGGPRVQRTRQGGA